VVTAAVGGVGTVRVVESFPPPPRLVAKAYSKLQVLQSGDEEAIRGLGPLELLERPWEPHRCGPASRRQLWDWLDDIAAWVNHEYGWGVERLIPPCWPAHPHIAQELPVLADQRYTAGQAFHSGALEEWHRFTLPLFLERMTARLGNRCVTRHDEWPAAPRYRAFTSPEATSYRSARFDEDTSTPPRHLAVVDVNTGQVIHEAHPATSRPGPPDLPDLRS